MLPNLVLLSQWEQPVVVGLLQPVVRQGSLVVRMLPEFRIVHVPL